MVLSESYMGKPAALAEAAAAYQPAAGGGSGGYWSDWVEAHAAVGLVHRLDDEVAVVVTMTPLKAGAHRPRARASLPAGRAKRR